MDEKRIKKLEGGLLKLHSELDALLSKIDKIEFGDNERNTLLAKELKNLTTQKTVIEQNISAKEKELLYLKKK